MGPRDEIGLGICGIGGATDVGKRPDEMGPDEGATSRPNEGSGAITAGGGSGASRSSPASSGAITTTCGPRGACSGNAAEARSSEGFVTEIGVRSSTLSSKSSPNEGGAA